MYLDNKIEESQKMVREGTVKDYPSNSMLFFNNSISFES